MHIMTKCFNLEFTAPFRFLRTRQHSPWLPHLPGPSTQIGKQVTPFICAFPGLSYVWNAFSLPLMGSLPSIIYGAYQNTLSPQPSPPTENTKVILCLPLCLQKTENFASECKSACTVYFTPSSCDALFNLCILYDLNVILSGSAPCYRLLFQIR